MKIETEMETQNFVKLLDPHVVAASCWANFDTSAPDLKRLKVSIEHAGGNVSPIKVRPAPAQEGRFEIVFGHARHRACRELGLLVAAVVDEMSDHQLVNQQARRPEDRGHDLWTSLQRVQENSLGGGQPGRTAQGRRTRTRAVGSIDRSVALNRALWVLAEEMRKLKG